MCSCRSSAAEYRLQQWQQAEFVRGPLRLSGTDAGAHVLCRWVVWGCSCVLSPSLFTIASVKMKDADMPVPQCSVVPAGCTCQIALRAGPLQPPPDMKHQLSVGFLHLHATWWIPPSTPRASPAVCIARALAGLQEPGPHGGGGRCTRQRALLSVGPCGWFGVHGPGGLPVSRDEIGARLFPTALCMDMPAARHASPSYPLISLQRGLCTRVFATNTGNSVSV